MKTKTKAPASRPGYFGPYGGQFVPETLMAALEQLEREYLAGDGGQGVPGRAGPLLPRDRRPAQRAVLRRRLTRAARRGEDLPQARGPEPHRRAQDQQHARPGAADAADGQEARHRRDRRRPARRGHGHGGGGLRPGVRRLHGHRGHPPPGAQRLPHEAAGRAGRPRRQPASARSRTPSTRPCATGWAASSSTHYIIGSVAGPAPVPDDGPRVPVLHRPRGRGSRCSRPRAACPT